ncbi:MAG: NAD(P)-dependent alcohol dehydrogenase [Anaerolineae bacterium]|nr:NAD(P)-dependent alcohol dehydrogenase [Anaerolineae bacterium]NUQ05416.1 NAD(P)-dependent alcohol dehydrogenase [Anaerolineae bacterium]
MKAMVYTQYGSPDQLRLVDVPKPTPKAGEVLVKVHAAAANSSDIRTLRGQPFIMRLAGSGLLKPKRPILGGDIAGRVEAVGSGVMAFKPGDAVYGDLSDRGMGGFAEYTAAPQEVLAPMPARLSFEEAAALPLAAVTALQALRDKAAVRAGERVAINGASGGVGTFAVQIAYALGAEVTAIAGASKLEMLRALGAAQGIDYAAEDFTTRADQYDVILGVNGYHPLAHYARALKSGGRYVMVGGSDAQIFEAMLRAPLMRKRDGRTLGYLYARTTTADLREVAALVERGAVKPIIERCYPLAELAEALRALEAGHARGKLVITIHSGD